MDKILVSHCLLGEPVRYDGQSKPCLHPQLALWQQQDLLVCICPEVAGGLAVPRAAAEIQGGDGVAVLAGQAKVVNAAGENLSESFLNGAHLALQLCQKHSIKMAILKARSPSCANAGIYNGQFNKTLSEGMGVTAALLTREGIRVFNENELEQARHYHQSLSAQSSGKL